MTDSTTTLLFELPYGAEAPPLSRRAGTGVTRVLSRGPQTFTACVTIFDTPDHRLLRNGLLLATRVVDGTADWYFAAPTWAPLLPAEDIRREHGDMPADFAHWAVPFRRHAGLEPVVEMESQRRGFRARDDADQVVALLDEQLVTIRAGGMTTNRFREVTVELSESVGNAQREEIIQAMFDVGATSVAAFPSMHQRIGAPATGVADMPQRRQWQREDSLEQFAAALLATRTRDLVEADLATRRGFNDGTIHGEALRAIADDLRGLDGMMDPTWSRTMISDLSAHIRDATPLDAPSYLSILERLISSSRSPQTNGKSRRGAAALLKQTLDDAVATMLTTAEKLQSDSSEKRWAAAADAAHYATWRVRIWHVLQGKKVRELAARIGTIADALADCTELGVEPAAAALREMSPEDAFRLGRDFERGWVIQNAHRAEFTTRWPRRRRRVERAL